jgi:hypothetical protein
MCFEPVLADGGQLVGVLLILAGAVGYLTLYYRRKFTGDGGGCGCGCGIPFRKARDGRSAPPAAGDRPGRPVPFVPAENLADLAARHRRELDEKAGDLQPRE